MKEAAIKQCLKELTQALSSLETGKTPKGSPLGIYEPEGGTDEAAIVEYLAQLRLKLKYLLFDLEATRRENRYLRQMLDVHRKRRSDRDDDSNGKSGW